MYSLIPQFTLTLRRKTYELIANFTVILLNQNNIFYMQFKEEYGFREQHCRSFTGLNLRKL